MGGNHAVSGLKFRILRRFLVLGYAVRRCCGLLSYKHALVALGRMRLKSMQKGRRKRKHSNPLSPKKCGVQDSASC